MVPQTTAHGMASQQHTIPFTSAYDHSEALHVAKRTHLAAPENTAIIAQLLGFQLTQLPYKEFLLHELDGVDFSVAPVCCWCCIVGVIGTTPPLQNTHHTTLHREQVRE